jgi:hypothetical protein
MKHIDSDLKVASAFDANTSAYLLRVFCVCAFVIGTIGIFREMSTIASNSERVVDSFSLFGGHQNLTSWYQAMALGLSALMWLMMASTQSGSTRSQLTVGAAVLFYMSVGEHTNFDHEFSMRLISRVTPAEYVTPAAMGLAALIAASLYSALMPAVRRTHRYAALLGFGFLVYVCGAIGFECVTGFLVQSQGAGDLYIAAASTEELLETLGCMLFACAMIKHLTISPSVGGSQTTSMPS